MVYERCSAAPLHISPTSYTYLSLHRQSSLLIAFARTHANHIISMYRYRSIRIASNNEQRTTNSYKLLGCGEALCEIGGEHLMNIVVVTPISISVTIYISFDIRHSPHLVVWSAHHLFAGERTTVH